MSIKRLALLVFIFAAFAATAATSGAPMRQDLPAVPKNAFGYMKLTVDQLAAAMPGKSFVLVNVHVPDPQRLPHTDVFIAFDRITANLDKLPDKNAPIVIYCRSGAMSSQAAAALAAAGYTRVYELSGGLNAWKRAGRELLDR